ncbi:MAG TPA: TM2 domain-containing protein [Chryseolinea sp.]
MNKYQLQGKIKSTGVAILFWFLIGAHFAYLEKWGLQIVFWLTIGGLGIWWIIELFLIPGRVARYNADIYKMIDEVDKKEKADEVARYFAIKKEAKG